MLTFEQIKELIDLVTERKLASLEVERSGFRLRIEGEKPASLTTATPVAPPTEAPAVAVDAARPRHRSSSPGRLKRRSPRLSSPACSPMDFLSSEGRGFPRKSAERYLKSTGR